MTRLSKTFIHTLAASSSFAVHEGDGFNKISVKNSDDSAGSVTVTGSGTAVAVGGIGNGSVLAAGEIWTWVAEPTPFNLSGITITTEAGTTAEITAG